MSAGPDTRLISREFIKEFLDLYKSQTCLWQMKSRTYTDRFKRQKAYSLLIEKMKEVDRAANRSTVVRKIDSFRGAFRKELRKVKRSMMNGDEDVYKPKLWYFDQLKFLASNTFGRGSKADIKQEPTDTNQGQSSDEDFSFSEAIVSQAIADPLCVSPVPSDNVSNVPQTYSQPTDSHRKGTKRYLSDDVSRMEPPENPTPNKSWLSNHNFDRRYDEFTVMGENIANKLRRLRSEQVLIVEKLITDLIFEAECGNISQFTRLNLCEARNGNTSGMFFADAQENS